MEDFLERLKVFVWKLTYGTYYSVCYKLTFPMRRRLRILDSVATVRYIAEKRCSVSRYGDGEFQMVTHYINHGTSGTFHIDSFQCYDVALAARLLEVFTEPLQNHLICVPYAFKDSSVQKGYQRVFFEREWLFRRSYIAGTLCSGILLGDACFTRFYYGRRDIKDFKEYVGLLKTIWDNRKLLIVEGEQSRLGVGNDLFDNAVGIHRILCPSADAFCKYEQIFSAVKKLSKDYLVLVALGQTATVLAYDLAKCGYQAIDIGHIDIEYEWLRMKAKHKMAVPGKYVNEVSCGRVADDIKDPVYQSQIIERIG